MDTAFSDKFKGIYPSKTDKQPKVRFGRTDIISYTPKEWEYFDSTVNGAFLNFTKKPTLNRFINFLTDILLSDLNQQRKLMLLEDILKQGKDKKIRSGGLFIEAIVYLYEWFNGATNINDETITLIHQFLRNTQALCLSKIPCTMMSPSPEKALTYFGEPLCRGIDKCWLNNVCYEPDTMLTTFQCGYIINYALQQYIYVFNEFNLNVNWINEWKDATENGDLTYLRDYIIYI